MQKAFTWAAIVAALLSLSAPALAASSAPAMVGHTAKGATLVDAHGMTLYTFDKDTGGKSACNGACATNWPPLAAASGSAPSGDYSVTTRADGTSQWAYKARPLYRWKNDAKPGDTTGDGLLNNQWHVATP